MQIDMGMNFERKGWAAARVENTGFEEHLPWDFAEIDAQQIIPHDLTIFQTFIQNR